MKTEIVHITIALPVGHRITKVFAQEDDGGRFPGPNVACDILGVGVSGGPLEEAARPTPQTTNQLQAQVSDLFRQIHNVQRRLGRIESQAPAVDCAVAAEGIQILFQATDKNLGTISLQRWPEGYVLWAGGVMQWRSFK